MGNKRDGMTNKTIWVLAALLLSSGCKNKVPAYLANQKTENSETNISPVSRESKYAGLFDEYERLRISLTNDNWMKVDTSSRELARRIGEVSEGADGSIQKLGKATNLLIGENKTELKRRAFGEISQAIVTLYKKEKLQGLDLYHCPMAKGIQYWLQPAASKIGNPYMGKKMPRCGTKEKTS